MVEPIERLIAGRYRLGPVIGRGGMATVHRATDTRLERDVAVKLLRPEVGADPDLAQRFRREALAATVLRHPNIVACLDAGTDGDQPYLIMELVEGEDLAARLKRGGRLAPSQVARIGLDVARAMGVAHLRGIVHRDIKPGNILLAGDGRAMVTDFGIARLAMDAEATLPGTTMGSIHYFSPEQARGMTTTPAYDVYGLGLVLFEALTGERAWTGDSSDAIALARVGTVAPSARDRRAEVPAELDAVVRRALAPDADDRYPSGAAMAAALERIVAATDPSSPTLVIPIPVARGPESRSPTPSAPTGGRSSRPAGSARAGRQGPRAGALIVLMAALLAGIGLSAALIAAMSDRQGSALATRQPTQAPDVAPTPTDPPATSEPTASPTLAPSAAPTPTLTPVPPGEVADLCEVFFELACGLAPGRYSPSKFELPFALELGEGWSALLHEAQIVTLVRDEGLVTFASGIATVFPDGQETTTRGRPRDLIEAFIATDGVGSSDGASVRIGGRRGLSVDLAPTGGERVALFTSDSASFFLEPDRTTRVLAIDVRGGTVIIAIEPSAGGTLDEILASADGAAATIDWP